MTANIIFGLVFSILFRFPPRHIHAAATRIFAVKLSTFGSVVDCMETFVILSRYGSDPRSDRTDLNFSKFPERDMVIAREPAAPPPGLPTSGLTEMTVIPFFSTR